MNTSPGMILKWLIPALFLATVALSPPRSGAQGSQVPRAALTPQQAQLAVRSAREASAETRKRAEEPARGVEDRREYVVGLELLDLKEQPKAARSAEGPAGAPPARPEEPPAQTESGNTSPPAAARGTGGGDGPFALVTTYRYSDDVTVFTTVDVSSGKAVRIEETAHLRTALSDEEYEEAKVLANERSEPVKALREKFGERLSVYPQFSQITLGDDPRIHRVVHLTYRVGTKDLSYPRPRIDLTTLEVETSPPERFPEPRKPRQP